MNEIEKIRRYVDKTVFDSERYQMLYREIMALRSEVDNAPIETIILAFCYGRAKGYRAATAHAKRGKEAKKK